MSTNRESAQVADSVPLTPVKSSNIKAVGHDPATDTLHVEFQGGGRYAYAGVSARQHFNLVRSGSIGSHLAEHIKPKHKATKL